MASVEELLGAKIALYLNNLPYPADIAVPISNSKYVRNFTIDYETINDLRIEVMVRRVGIGHGARDCLVEQYIAEYCFLSQIELESDTEAGEIDEDKYDRLIQMLRFADIRVVSHEGFIGTDGVTRFRRVKNLTQGDQALVADNLSYDEEALEMDRFIAASAHVFSCRSNTGELRNFA